MEDRYVMLVDENGRPYIAHAFSLRKTFNRAKNTVKNTASNLKSGGAKSYKYIQKVVKNGKTRYFYDQKEWEAYLRGDVSKPKTIVGKAKDKLGYDEREKRNKAQNDYESDKRVGRRLENRGKEKLMEIDDSNPNARKQLEEAKSLRQKGLNMQKEANKKLDEASKEYDKTFLGKLENLNDRVTGKKSRQECERRLDEYLHNPTAENANLYATAYKQWKDTVNFKGEGAMNFSWPDKDGNISLIEYPLTPKEAKQKAVKETSDMLHQVMQDAQDVANLRVSAGDDGYMHLDSPEASDRAMWAKKYADKLEELEKTIKNSDDQTEVRDLIDEYRRDIKKLKTENEKEAKELALHPKNYFGFDNIKELLDQTRNKDYKKLVSEITDKDIVYNQLEIYHDIPSEDTIISNLGGGDETAGSCASLAMAYIGNKAGYKVLDFRGGDSQDIFSQNLTIERIMTLDGVESKANGWHQNITPKEMLKKTSELSNAVELLKTAEEGKEYYLAAGRHAAIVRKQNGKYQYLELQSGYDNGWKGLDNSVLYWRFVCSKKESSLVSASYMIDIDTLANNKEFISLLGYINTDQDKQKKGAGGHEK